MIEKLRKMFEKSIEVPKGYLKDTPDDSEQPSGGNIMNEEIVVLNGKELTNDEFETKKKSLEEKKGVSLVKLSEGHYKTRIQG